MPPGFDPEATIRGGFPRADNGQAKGEEVSSTQTRIGKSWVACGIGCLVLQASLFAADERAVYYNPLPNLLASDPQLKIPPSERVISEPQKQLWIDSLDHSEVSLRCQIADAISSAKRSGLGEWSEAIPKLEGLLQESKVHDSLRRAVSRTLVELDARDAGPLLAQQSDILGPLSAQFIEPALARWDYQPRRDAWLKRLADPAMGVQRGLFAACLGVVREPRAMETLRMLVLASDTPVQLRLQAARAMGEIQREGLEADVRKLVATDSQLDPKSNPHLLAASLLRWHEGSDAVELLLQLGQHKQTAVAAVALQRLYEIDPKLVFPIVDPTVRSPDVNVRRIGSKVLIAKADLEAIALLATMLGDLNLELRTSVREALFQFAQQDAFRAAVIGHGEHWLEGSENWRAIEQSIILLGKLDHKPCAMRLVEFLPHPRYEVYVAAAWGLARLQVTETLPPMLEFATSRTEVNLQTPGGGREIEDRYEEIGHLFEAFGPTKYAPAEGLLRRYVPKTPAMSQIARGGAIWSLGYLHAEQGDEELAALFAERLADVLSPMPEFPYVRLACAISLGRMKSKSQLATLERFAKMEGPYSSIGVACWWAVAEITGKQTTPSPPLRREVSGWFLQPIVK